MIVTGRGAVSGKNSGAPGSRHVWLTSSRSHHSFSSNVQDGTTEQDQIEHQQAVNGHLRAETLSARERLITSEDEKKVRFPITVNEQPGMTLTYVHSAANAYNGDRDDDKNDDSEVDDGREDDHYNGDNDEGTDLSSTKTRTEETVVLSEQAQKSTSLDAAESKRCITSDDDSDSKRPLTGKSALTMMDIALCDQLMSGALEDFDRVSGWRMAMMLWALWCLRWVMATNTGIVLECHDPSITRSSGVDIAVVSMLWIFWSRAMLIVQERYRKSVKGRVEAFDQIFCLPYDRGRQVANTYLLGERLLVSARVSDRVGGYAPIISSTS